MLLLLVVVVVSCLAPEYVLSDEVKFLLKVPLDIGLGEEGSKVIAETEEKVDAAREVLRSDGDLLERRAVEYQVEGGGEGVCG